MSLKVAANVKRACGVSELRLTLGQMRIILFCKLRKLVNSLKEYLRSIKLNLNIALL
jgi:hypothetical protein